MMKWNAIIKNVVVLSVISFNVSAQADVGATSGKSLYFDILSLEPGSIENNEAADAHARDLAVQNKYGVNFIRYWVDRDKGKICYLSLAPNAESISKAHAEAHGLLSIEIYKIAVGVNANSKPNRNYFIDIHKPGAGNTSPEEVAAAYQKDLSVQRKYGVHFFKLLAR